MKTDDDTAASESGIKSACALCCERRAGIVFSSLPMQTQEAIVKDAGIEVLVVNARKNGQPPSEEALAHEMARVLRTLRVAH